MDVEFDSKSKLFNLTVLLDEPRPVGPPHTTVVDCVYRSPFRSNGIPETTVEVAFSTDTRTGRTFRPRRIIFDSYLKYIWDLGFFVLDMVDYRDFIESVFVKL